MTANALISQALGLQASYIVLKGKSNEVLSIDIDRKLLIFTGLSQSSSIILSFAIEIALKGLLKFRFDKFPKTHDLKKLYEKLHENDRIEISNLYKQKTNSDIEECLERHKDMFMEFRYLEIEIDEPNDNIKVNAALTSVIEFYNRIKNNI
jgi:HEPN domain-containing protein